MNNVTQIIKPLLNLIFSFAIMGVSHADLVGHWKLDEAGGSNTVNSVIDAYTAEVVGSGNIQLAQAGAVTGTGTSSSHTGGYWVNNENSITPGQEAWRAANYSFSVWVKADTTTGLTAALSTRSGGSQGWTLYTDGTADTLSFWSRHGSSWQPLTANVDFANHWYHVVGTFNSASGKKHLYVSQAGGSFGGVFNSNIAGRLDPTTHETPSETRLGIGAHPDGADSYRGLIDDVQIYNHSLSSTEAQFLFTNPGQSAANTLNLPADPENFHIFLLMGQSNMAGYGGNLPSDPYDPADFDEIPNIFVLDGQSFINDVTPIPRDTAYWRKGSHRLHLRQPSTQFGLGIDFAKHYMEQNPGVSVGLVPCAWGGAAINSLNKGSSLYSNSMSRVQIAKLRGNIKGVLWHQGESDSVNTGLASLYYDKLAQYLTDLRADLDQPTLPFIVGNLAEFYGQGRSQGHQDGIVIIRQALRDLAANDFWVKFVETTNLTSIDQHDVHFDRASFITLGERYGDAMNELFSTPYLLDYTSQPNGNRLFSWTQSIGQAYDVEYSMDLSSWTTIAANLSTASYTDTDPTRLAADRSFYRLVIKIPVVQSLVTAQSISQDAGTSSSSRPPINLINNATNVNYTSPSGATNAWHTTSGTTTSTFTMTLAQNYNLTEFYLWNYNHNSSWQLGVGTFTLEVSSTDTGENFVQVGGTYSATGGGNVNTADVHPFIANNVRRVRWKILSNLGGTTSTVVAAAEVSFLGSPTITP